MEFSCFYRNFFSVNLPVFVFVLCLKRNLIQKSSSLLRFYLRHCIMKTSVICGEEVLLTWIILLIFPEFFSLSNSSSSTIRLSITFLFTPLNNANFSYSWTKVSFIWILLLFSRNFWVCICQFLSCVLKEKVIQK